MNTTDLEPLASRELSPEQVVDALTTLALNGGQVRKTAAQLKQRGIQITHQNLSIWRTHKFPNRYRQISEELAPQIEASVVDLQRALALNATTAALDAVALEAERIETGEVKDTAASARNLSTVAGIAVDKILSLTGRPTNITEHRTVEQALQKLGSIIGTAELVSETPKNDESPH